MAPEPYMRPGDLVFVRSPGLFGRLIRAFERSPHAPVNHVAVVVMASVGNPDEALIVEANARGVQYHRVSETGWDSRTEVAVFTMDTLQPEDRKRVVQKALSYEGDRYDFLKIAAHLGDWLLGGRYVFRRLAGMDKYPICSWVGSHAYKYVGVTFGVSANEAAPDDMYNWCASHPELWRAARPLAPWRPS